MNTPRQKRIKVTTKDGATITLTPKQKEYADKKMANPNQSLASIAREVYPNATPATARQLVNQNEQNKNIALYSSEQLKDAQTLIHNTVNNEDAKIRDRLTAAFRIEDRNLGTVVQQVQTTSKTVQINIDLSGETSDILNS